MKESRIRRSRFRGLSICKCARMDVAVRPKESEAGEEPDECFEIAWFLHKRAHAQFISPINLFPRHRAGVHHHWDMFVDRMFLEPAQNRETVQDWHAVIEDDDAWFAGRALA